jgi:hypothetical protein
VQGNRNQARLAGAFDDALSERALEELGEQAQNVEMHNLYLHALALFEAM